MYNLSNEDFGLKYVIRKSAFMLIFNASLRYGVLAWPWKIRTMLEQVEEQHKEDEDRFKKLQVQDTATLNDKIDQLIVRLITISLFLQTCSYFCKLDVCCWSFGTHEHGPCT